MRKTIVEVISELTGQTPVQYSAELKAIICPFHDDQKPSLVIYEHTDSYFCFPCGMGGDVYNFVSKFKQISYRAAKEFIDGNTDKLEEITQLLDGIGVKDEIDFSKELNFAVSRYCRDLLYKKPQLLGNITKFLSNLDHTILTKPVSNDILKRTIKESRELDQ